MWPRIGVPSAGFALLAMLCGCSAGPASAHDAQIVVEQLAHRVPSVRKVVPVGGVDDPGRPLVSSGAYMSKADFLDSRLMGGSGVRGVVAAGGVVEAYSSESEAKARRYSLHHDAGVGSIDPEFDYAVDSILLRLSAELTADQVAEYESALNEIVTRR